jgi:hypothetical protein
MKKIIALSVGVLFCTLVFANGTDEPTTSSVAVMDFRTNLFKVFYKSATYGNVKVSIFNENQTMVFSESVRKTHGFVRPYNFENLPEGQYTILVEDGTGKHSENIVWERKSLKKVNIVKIPSTDSKYLLTGFSKNADNIRVSIYDNEGKIIFEEDRDVNGKFNQIYNLKNLKGSFSIEVSDAHGILKNFKG